MTIVEKYRTWLDEQEELEENKIGKAIATGVAVAGMASAAHLGNKAYNASNYNASKQSAGVEQQQSTRISRRMYRHATKHYLKMEASGKSAHEINAEILRNNHHDHFFHNGEYLTASQSGGFRKYWKR